MKKILLTLAAVAAACTAFAATPVAVWDGDFTPTELKKFEGYTLEDWNETHGTDYNSVTIDRNNQGLMFDATSPMGGLTVMVRYSGLSSNGSNSRVLFTSSVTSLHQYDRTGIQLKSDGNLVGLWNSSTTSNNNTDNGTAAGSISASGVMAFTYSTAGTYLYYGATTAEISSSSAWGSSGLKSSSDTAIYGAGIGGMYRNSSKSGAEAAKGMTITALAVFDKVLTASEMQSYIWPSETQQIVVDANTSVSALNTRIAGLDETIRKVVFSVADGVTINVDAAFSSSVVVAVESAGTVTLSSSAQPDAAYLSSVDFSGVQGALLRSWLTPGVVGVNFHKAQGNVVSDEVVASGSWVATTGANGNSTDLFADGLTKVTWSASGTYSYYEADDEAVSFLHGYLDDGGAGVKISVTSVPYETYDVVVYASTDTSNVKFRAKTVNNVAYTVIAGETAPGNADWGRSRLETASYGVNAMRVKNLSGNLTISGGTNNGNRGGIAAIQIMPTTAADKPEPEYELSLDGTDVSWSAGSWELGGSAVSAPLSGNARITFSASTTLTIDGTVALNKLVLDGADNAVLTIVLDAGASLVSSGFVAIEGGVLKQGMGSVLGATPSVYVKDGGTFDLNSYSINAATSVYIAGAGADNWPWALTSSSGAGGAILGGLYLTANATIGGANELKVGQTGNGYYCYLQGYTLTKTGAGALTCTNMNTPGTGTIDVQGGAMSVNQWNNLNNNGGSTTVILHEGTSLANGTDRIVPMGTLELLGGTLTTTRAFKINTLLTGSGEAANLAFADGASALLTGDLAVTTALTLQGAMAFNKDANAANDVAVTVSGAMSSSGAISVGAGVTLNLGTNRPTGEITVDDDATLSVKMLNNADVVSLSVSAQPANLVVYDENGDELDDPRVTYSEGTLTIMAQLPTLSASGAVAFDTAANWNNSIMPVSHGDAIIELSDDAVITVSGTYTLGSLTITGAGEVSFSGGGSIAAANISLRNGATLTSSSKMYATDSFDIDSGTVLRLNGITVPAVISGAGAVETYGNVVLTTNNTMTGGITVKSGSALSTTVPGGYGEYSASWAYSAQRQVVVEDGGTVDINNIANNDGAVALTIEGKGILSGDVYSGAVTYSGASAISSGSRQISSLVLTGDALVDVGAGWGLVHSGWGNARLGLNGHTLTVRGTGTFPVVNVNKQNGTATTGTLVMDGAKLELSRTASNLDGVNVVAKGCAAIDISAEPSGLGSMTIKPSAAGTTASNWTLPSSPLPVVDTSNIDTAGLADDQVLTIFTAPSALPTGAVSVRSSPRFTTAINGNTVTATFHAGTPTPFLHYEFNNSVAAASDSTTSFSLGGEGGSPSYAGSKNGQAVNVHTGYTPYWGTYANGTSPFHAGEVTVTAVAKLGETGIILWGLGSGNTGMGLVSVNANTAAVVARRGTSAVETLATLTTTADLTKGWHFYVVVADANGVTLYVDKESASSDKSFPFGIGQQGQLGSFHGGAWGGGKAGSVGDGYLLDDWRVYDCALTPKEVNDLRWQLNRDPLFFMLR